MLFPTCNQQRQNTEQNVIITESAISQHAILIQHQQELIKVKLQKNDLLLTGLANAVKHLTTKQ